MFFPVNFDKFFIFLIKYLRVNSFVPFKLLWDFTSILEAINKYFSYYTSPITGLKHLPLSDNKNYRLKKSGVFSEQ